VCGRIETVEIEVPASPGSGAFDRESVLDYGDCAAAANAPNPRNPSQGDLATCPIFKNKIRNLSSPRSK